MTLARLAAAGRLNVGAFAALGIASLAAITALAAFISVPLNPAEWGFAPKQIWPWWPGAPSQALLVLVSALFALGLAAFIRRPRSGTGQALLAGSAGNAASVALWSTIVPDELGWRSASWLAFVGAGFLSLVLWSSLLHLVFVFPTRDRWIGGVRWLIPAIYVLPALLLATGAVAIGAFDPTSLAWVDAWARVHAAIVSLILVVVIVGIAVRLRGVSRVRRRQVAGIAAAVAS